MIKLIKIENRNEDLTEKLTDIWEKSVIATHMFLSLREISEIKEYVPGAIKEVSTLIVAENDNGDIMGFMGTEGTMLEMLFLSPDYIGTGAGKALVQYGIDNLSVSEVTVNEQNPNAKGFYEYMGFKIYKRTETDRQGRPYPLLYMKLQ